MITYIDHGKNLRITRPEGTVYVPKDPKNGDYQRALAEVEAGAAEIVDHTPSLADRKRAKAASAQAIFEEKIRAGRAHGGHIWQIDDASQNRIEAMGSLALSHRNSDGSWDEAGWESLWSDIEGGFVFISAANAKVPLSAQQMFELARAIGTYIAPLRYRLRDVKTAIAGAASQAALDAIDENGGWPS